MACGLAEVFSLDGLQQLRVMNAENSESAATVRPHG
jgi:hypothetical protein